MNDARRLKLESAIISAVRVFCYAALTTIMGMIGSQVTGVGDVPSVDSLQAIGVAALWSGTVALVAFGWNMLRPRNDIAAGK